MKESKKKMLYVILFGIIFSVLSINSIVKASSTNSEISDFANSEEKIMKYEVATGEITEVNKEELLQVMNCLKNGEKEEVLGAYNPYELTYSPKVASKTSKRASFGYKITDTSAFPYRVTCKVNSRSYRSKD